MEKINRRTENVKKLHNNLENKSKLSVFEFEKQATLILDKFDIDNRINAILEIYIKPQIEKHEAYILKRAPDIAVHSIINQKLFNTFLYEVDTIINSITIQSEVAKTFFSELHFTDWSFSIKKSKLAAIHYLFKYLDDYAESLVETNKIKKRAAGRLFYPEIKSIIGSDNEIIAFALTIRSLIDNWICKYEKKTKIGKFYYDHALKNADIIVENIARYILTTVISNKNPLLLRAIFSTYINLIHKQIYSYLGEDINKFKIVSIPALMFSNNEQTVALTESQKKLLIYDIMQHHANQKKKSRLKRSDYMYTDIYFSKFLKPNFIRYFGTAGNNHENIIDHSVYFTKDKKNAHQSGQNTFYKIKDIEKNGRSKFKNYFTQILTQEAFSNINAIIGDQELTTEILEAMADQIYQQLDPDCYVDADFNPVNDSNIDYTLIARQIGANIFA